MNDVPDKNNRPPVETIYVDELTVRCDGGEEPLGHPLVYLTLKRDGKIDCPYCGRLYIHDPDRAKND
jgi:uncharacterized Zn-finger protein